MKVTENPHIKYTNPKTHFKIGVKQVLTPQEQLEILTQRSMEVLKGMVQMEVPEKGRMKRNVSANFDIPSTNNNARIAVEESAVEKETNRDLVVGVRHKQRDRLASNLLAANKTKKEILAYLNNKKNIPQIIESIQHLSNETDDYYNSL